MKIEKHFDFTFSHKFPNGDIASVRFGTLKEVESVYDSANNSKELIDFEDNLAKDVYERTMSDIKNVLKVNKVAKAIFKGIKESVRTEKIEQEAISMLDEV